MSKTSKIATLASKLKDAKTQILFTSFNSKQQTALSGDNATDKQDLIEYFNEIRPSDLNCVLNIFTDINADNKIVSIADIYEEGILLTYTQILSEPSETSQKASSKQTNDHSIFVPFRTQRQKTYERLHLLVFEAQIKSGQLEDLTQLIIPSKDKKNTVAVTHTKFVTPNILRIHIKSQIALPKTEPGYAYRISLMKLKPKNSTDSSKLPAQTLQKLKHTWAIFEPVIENTIEKSNKTIKQLPYTKEIAQQIKKYGLLTLLEAYKRTPQEKQDKNAKTPDKTTQQSQQQKKKKNVEKRYYTLRQTKSNSDPFAGEIDIFIHDGTPGSIWAQSLQPGDLIKIDNIYKETIKDTTVGQPLLICDETSMPAVAATLEQWKTENVPIVICITHDERDLSYFDELILPKQLKNNLSIQHVNSNQTDNIAQAVINLIAKENKHIDCAWGAIGKSDFHAIKQYLRDNYRLKGRLNRLRAYWV